METCKIVFAGFRLYDDDKLVAKWFKLRQVDGGWQPDEDGGPLSFGKSKSLLGGKGVWLGDVYESEINGSSVKVTGNRVDLGDWLDKDARQRWRVEERAAQARVEQLKMVKKESFGDMTLDELKQVYHKQVGSARRAAVLASIIQHVTK